MTLLTAVQVLKYRIQKTETLEPLPVTSLSALQQALSLLPTVSCPAELIGTGINWERICCYHTEQCVFCTCLEQRCVNAQPYCNHTYQLGD